DLRRPRLLLAIDLLVRGVLRLTGIVGQSFLRLVGGRQRQTIGSRRQTLVTDVCCAGVFRG
ncbi:MAG TPA: hypothetical protein VFN45_18425, partial [Myxococcaceae bacterium]|nr:hypothetical protein [Myxococcaceae bacterium]